MTPDTRQSHFSFGSLRKKKSFLMVNVLLCVLMMAALAAFCTLTTARTTGGVVMWNGDDAVPFTLPFKDDDAMQGAATLRFTLSTGVLPVTRFHVVPDDCLDMLEVNGRQVSEFIPFCDYTEGRTIDLSEYLHSGDNTIVARITNAGGAAMLRFMPSFSDPSIIVLSGIILCLLAAWTSLFIFLSRLSAPVRVIIFIVIAGALLRTWYVMQTPYWLRGHDTDGHIEYVEYLIEHKALPDPAAGWEFWQPPLYYTAGAVVAGAAKLMHFPREQQLFALQAFSLFLSIVTLVCAAYAARMLFDHRRQPYHAAWMTAVIACMPGLIFIAARINNDALAVPLGFAILTLLIRWWKDDSRRFLLWIFISVGISLHLLTKNTGLLLLPVAFGCLAVRRNMRLKHKAAYGALSLGIIAALAGWISVYRAVDNASGGALVGNITTLNSGLLIANDVASYAVFNPLKIVQIPFNNPWDDAARRTYFWEYWYRSAFFGEFGFGMEKMLLASWMLFWSLLAVLIAASGLVRSLRDQTYRTVPLLLTFCAFAIGQAVFRFQYPYGPSQDFRYSLIILIPIGYWMALGVCDTRNPVIRRVAMYTVQTAIILCGMFILSI